MPGADPSFFLSDRFILVPLPDERREAGAKKSTNGNTYESTCCLNPVCNKSMFADKSMDLL